MLRSDRKNKISERMEQRNEQNREWNESFSRAEPEFTSNRGGFQYKKIVKINKI